jgi:hypothetical protein
MKLIIVKAIIGWLIRKHFRLLYEAVVPTGSHVQRHKISKKEQTADLINHYSPAGQTATGGMDS